MNKFGHTGAGTVTITELSVPSYIWSTNPTPADVHFISVYTVCHCKNSELFESQLQISGSNTHHKKTITVDANKSTIH